MTKKIIGIILLLIIAGFGYQMFHYQWSNLDYAPEQPIPFSHKLHAGDRNIPCMYCHTNVERSRHATIPSMNICMNCHSVVNVDSTSIIKLTEAYNSGKPLEWQRIHKVPEHAYFSHKWHIRKGFDCAVCHGPVETMDRVYQYRKLNMGDCIQCHRENEAPTSCNTCHQ
ncbi:cytochrome c family protein [bacterium]|nr:cytochrome c family protein [bacterium]MBU1638188.1 cytochrome c family protein [bacterium]